MLPFLAAVAALGVATSTCVAVVPRPVSVVLTGGELVLSNAVDVSAADVVWSEDPALGREAYALEVTPKALRARAATETGRFYALQTLRQLSVRLGEDRLGIALPCVRVSDAPRFAWRGIHLDESRHFFGKAAVKRFLDRMAYCKLNVLHWHLTDNPGWRIEIKRYFDYKNTERWADEPCVYPDWTPVLPLAKVYAYDPLEGIPEDLRSRVIGTQCENWTERTCTEAELDWKLWPRALAKAENAWTASERLDWKDFLSRAKIRRRVLVRDFGVNAAPVEDK